MMKLPKVVGLLLCERMDVDVQTTQVSLVGLFQSLRFETFPSLPQRFTVYAALCGGTGEGTIALTCTRLATEEDVYSYKRWVGFPGGGQVSQVELKVKRCAFPAPGRYSLTLRFDGQDLTTRYIDVLSK